jgi:hypothetical protein
MEKKVRFGDLVRHAGRPEVATLWTDPKRDSSFTKAIRQNRILTVLRKPTTKRTDYGMIGFHEEPQAMYLVFPRPLPQGQDSHVIGINYQLLDEPAVDNPVRPKASKPRKPPPMPKPAERTFTVKVRRTATLETSMSIQSASRKIAEKEAIASLKRQPFELDHAAMKEEVVGVE